MQIKKLMGGKALTKRQKHVTHIRRQRNMYFLENTISKILLLLELPLE